jgi:hypothetical protein
MAKFSALAGGGMRRFLFVFGGALLAPDRGSFCSSGGVKPLLTGLPRIMKNLTWKHREKYVRARGIAVVKAL